LRPFSLSESQENEAFRLRERVLQVKN